MSPQPLPTTVDLADLPEPVAASIRQLVDSVRAGLTAGASDTLIGRFAGQGVPTPDLDEFQAARREAWAPFPRDLPCDPG